MIYFFLMIVILICLFGWREQKVINYRFKLINKIGLAITKDIRRGNNRYAWRWDTFNEVSRDEMLFKFWKPLDSFYKNKDFLK